MCAPSIRLTTIRRYNTCDRRARKFLLAPLRAPELPGGGQGYGSSRPVPFLYVVQLSPLVLPLRLCYDHYGKLLPIIQKHNPEKKARMMQKPEYFTVHYAEAFKDQSVAKSYRLRPTYPAETFTILAGLLRGESRRVLDVGSGTGNVARHLVELVERVDAVDFSQA